jgi:hypothetical protein
MLLNGFLEEHRNVEQQDRSLQHQETPIARQQKQIETLAAGSQKVSGEIEPSKPPAQTVLNNH